MIDFILDTEEKVRQKLDMLQSLADIQIASKLLDVPLDTNLLLCKFISLIHLKKKENSNVDEPLIDSNYKKLNCKITALDKKVKKMN